MGGSRIQNFGPWTWLAVTYPHPTTTDEQPESFRAFPDLHIDRVYGNRQRWAAWWYRMENFCPTEILPGFLTHQTQRYDAQGTLALTDFRTPRLGLSGLEILRDFVHRHRADEPRPELHLRRATRASFRTSPPPTRSGCGTGWTGRTRTGRRCATFGPSSARRGWARWTAPPPSPKTGASCSCSTPITGR